MNYITSLECIYCKKKFSSLHVDYTCPECGPTGNLKVLYNYHSITKDWRRDDLLTNKDFSIWRYLPLLPVVQPDYIPRIQVGWTPVYEYPELAEKYGCKNLILKDEGRNPSASLKDRPSAIAVVKAIEKEAKIITCASTGNAASSLACACASVGLPCVIFVPERAPQAKVAQLLVFGAKVVMVKGSYDQAFDLCLKASERFGWYSRNTGYNPYLREGKKTFALELCEQLDWNPPDKIFVSVGDGNTFSAGWKAFQELHQMGWIETLPQMIAVQADGASPLVKAFKTNNPIRPEIADTVADSISVGTPRDGDAALLAVRESKGDAISVSDQEILDAIPRMAREMAVFAEPAASAAFAGFLQYANAGLLKKNERIAVMVTGNGLKDVQSAMKSITEIPFIIDPDEKELDKLVDAKGNVRQ